MSSRIRAAVLIAGLFTLPSSLFADNVVVSPNTANVAASGATNNTVQVLPNKDDTPWTAAVDQSWVTITSPISGVGNGNITYTVAPNPAAGSRVANLVVSPTNNNGIGTPGTLVITQLGGTLNISPSSANAQPAGDSGTVIVSTTNNALLQWSASSSDSWLKITSGATGTGPGSVQWTALANQGSSTRVAIITVTPLSGTGLPFTVTQQAIPPAISVSPSGVSLDAGAATGALTVTASLSNLTWTAAASGGQTWLTVTSGSSGTGNGSVQYSAAGNPTAVGRTASITITPGQGAAAVTVIFTQSGGALSISPASANVVAAGGTGSVSITTSDPVLGWTASSNSGWLTATPAAGTGNGTVTWTAAVNTTTDGRTATITITPSGGTPQTSTVYQAPGAPPASLSVIPTTAAAPASISNGSATINATPSSLSWTAASNMPWLTITTPSNGTGTGPLNYTATGNPTAAPRTATITVTPSTGSPATLTVTQAAGVLTISPLSANPASSGGTGPISVTTNNTTLQWTAASDSAWLTLSPTSGTGDATVTWVAAANSSASHRVGNISITPSGGLPLMFVVDQQALSGTITTSPTSITFSYQKGGTVPAAAQLSVNGAGGALPFTAAASVVSGGSWLSVGGASGTTPAVVNVSVTPGDLAVGTYQGSVTITSAVATNSPVTVSVTLNVTAAPVLTATPNALTFSFQQNGPNPGQQTVNLAGSGSAALNYSISLDPNSSWLSATGLGPTPATVAVSVNPSGLAVGTYTGSVIITAPAAGNSPLRIPVTLTVTAAPNLVSSPTSLSVSYRQLAPAPAPITLTISSSGANLPFTSSVSPSTPWLSVAGNGQTPSAVQVSINPAGLAIGAYQGSVILTSSGAGNNPLSVPVTLNVAAAPNLTFQPQQLNFAVTQGGTSTTATGNIALSSDPRVEFTTAVHTDNGGNWLSVSSSGTQTIATLTATAQSAGLVAGTYTGSIVITAPRAGNSPVTIPVTFIVSPQPQLTFTPSQLAFSYQLLSGSTPASQSFTVSTADHSAVSVAASVSTASGGNWLLVGQGGITPASMRVTVDPANLAAGTYSGTVTVTSPGYISAMVPVTLTVTTAPVLNVQPASLNFAIQLGVTVPLPQSVSVTSTPSLTYSVASGAGTPWLSVTGGGSTPSGISVSVDPHGLAAGTYQGTIAVSSSQAGNSPVLVPVHVNITAGPPINPQPTSLSFTYTQQGALPVGQVLSIGSSQTLSFSASVSSNESWLVVNGNSGVTPAGLTVTIDPSGLTPGDYSASIIISSPGAANDPLTIPVTLKVNPAPQLTPSQSQFTFSFQTPGTAPPSQTLTVTSGDPSLVVTASTDTSSGGNWLSIAGGGNIPAVFSISANPGTLSPGTYNGTVTLSAPNAGNSPLIIPVTLVVAAAPILSSSPSQLFFSYQIGNTPPSGTPIQITSSQGALTFQASATTSSGGAWLLSSTGATTPGTVTITVDPTGLAAGTYTGSVLIAAATAGNSPLTIPVTFTVSASAVLTAAPGAVQFVAQQGAAAPAPQTVHVMSGSANIPVTDMSSPGTPWLTFSGSPNSPGDLTISVSQTGLAAGRYSGAVIVKSDAAANSPLEIPVTLDVSVPPVLSASPAVLRFNYVLLGDRPLPQTFSVSSSAAPLDFSASVVPGSPWLFSTAQGTSPGTVSVTVDPGVLTAGTYQGTVVLTSSSSNTSVQVQVILTVSSAPTLSVLPAELTFAYQVGASLPASKSFVVSSDSGSPNVNETPLSFTGGSWLVVNGGGPTPATFTASAVPTGLAPGVYKSQISISGQGVSNNPLIVPVTLTVTSAPTLISSTANLTFAAQVNGSTPPNQQFLLTSSDGSAIPIGSVTTSQGGLLLSASIDATNTPATVTVSAATAGLSSGVYQSSVIVSSTSAGNSPLIIPVVVTISSLPSLTGSQTGVSFAFVTGGAAPLPVSLNIGSTGASLPFSGSLLGAPPWLSLTSSGTSTPTTIQLSANPAGLPPGIYYSAVLLSSGGAANNPLQIGVTLIVTASPLLIAAPTAVAFAAAPPFSTLSQTVQISSSGAGLSYSLSTSPATPWLSVSGGGTTTGTIQVTANPASLVPGTYNGTIQILAAGAGNSPLIIPVSLTVQQALSLQANPSPVSFAYSLTGTTPPPQTIAVTVGNQPANNIRSAVGAGTPWLSLQGAPGGALTVVADPTGLLPGTYTGTVVIAADGAGNSPVNVPVTLSISGSPTFDLSTDSVALAALEAQSQPVSSQVILTSGQNPPVNFELNVTASTWLTVTPLSGKTPTTVTVTANPSGLRPGNYAGSVIVSSDGIPLRTIGVNLTIATAPTFSVAPSFLVFRYSHGGNPPAPVNIVIGRFGADIAVVASTSDPWISVNPTTPTTTNPIAVTINPGTMPAGTYHGTITLALMSSSGGTTPVTTKQVPVALYIDEPANPQILSVQQAASFLTTPLSPGLIFSVFGTGLGPATPVGSQVLPDGTLSQSLGGVEVLVNGIPCPLLYVSQTQINAVAPYALFQKLAASVAVRNMGVLSDPVPVSVAVAAPGLFSEPPQGAGFGAILNQDQSVNTANNPAAKGSIITVFGTGEGQTNPPGIDGLVTSSSLLPRPLLPVSVTIAGIPATDITYAGAAPTFTAGALQINVRIPDGVPSGPVPVVLYVGNSVSQGKLTVTVR
jgi:uncharacterized protein (TIGR03437 family)